MFAAMFLHAGVYNLHYCNTGEGLLCSRT